MIIKGRTRKEQQQDFLENCDYMVKDKPNSKASKWFKTPPYAMTGIQRDSGIPKKEGDNNNRVDAEPKMVKKS